MKLVRVACGLMLVLPAVLPAAEAPAKLSLVKSRTGVEILKVDSTSPDSKGVIHRYALDLRTLRPVPIGRFLPGAQNGMTEPTRRASRRSAISRD